MIEDSVSAVVATNDCEPASEVSVGEVPALSDDKLK